jgi:hypothetical protein
MMIYQSTKKWEFTNKHGDVMGLDGAKLQG